VAHKFNKENENHKFHYLYQKDINSLFRRYGLSVPPVENRESRVVCALLEEINDNVRVNS
jgi:hypothetical protein